MGCLIDSLETVRTLWHDVRLTTTYHVKGFARERIKNTGLSQKPDIRSFLSLPKGDSANSEQSEESYLCPKSDVRRPKLKVAYLVAACHFEHSEKSILLAVIFWQ